MKNFMKTALALCLAASAFPCMAGIRADFRDVDINVFVDAVASATGTTIVHSAPLKGHISLKGDDLTREEYLSLMRTLLRANGYSVLTVGDVLKIVDEQDRAGIYPSHAEKEDPGTLVTRTLQLRTLPVMEVISQLNVLNGGKAKVTLSGMGSSNILMLSGYADEVSRFEHLASALDSEQGRSTVIVPLLSADANEIAKTVTLLITNGDFSKGSLKAGVIADSRTNSLLVSGTEDERRRLQSVIHRLDNGGGAPQGNSSVVYLKYTTSDTIEKVIGKLTKAKDPRFNDVSVVSAPDINAVVISAGREKQQQVAALIRQLDVRRAQVHVEAMIVEIADGDGINFGVQWGDNKGSLMQFANGSQIPLGALQAALQQAQSQGGSTVVSENGSTTINPDSQGDLSSLMALLGSYNGAAASIVKGNWTALVQAMKSNSHANILSTPSLTTQDNHSASFMVGENVPILTGSTASSDNKTPFQTVDRRDVGTRLTILPQINEGEAVQLKISAEVSKVEGNTGLDVVFAERKLETSVLVNDGSMIVLGGLIDKQSDESHYKVPILGDIPFIGRLFSSDAKKMQKRNLMIFIRPTILRDGLMADAVTRKKYSYIEAQQMLHEDDEGNIAHATDAQIPEIAAFHQALKKEAPHAN